MASVNVHCPRLRHHAVSPADLALLPLIACNGNLLLPGPIRSGSPILLIVCPEFRASMEAQMNHESVWNIEPVTHDE